MSNEDEVDEGFEDLRVRMGATPKEVEYENEIARLRAEVERLTRERRLFPIQSERGAKPHPTHIPWSVADKAYSVYSARYGRDQTLERLAERGGFGPGEMDDFYPAWREECDVLAAAISEGIAPFLVVARAAEAFDNEEAFREAAKRLYDSILGATQDFKAREGAITRFIWSVRSLFQPVTDALAHPAVGKALAAFRGRT